MCDVLGHRDQFSVQSGVVVRIQTPGVRAGWFSVASYTGSIFGLAVSVSLVGMTAFMQSAFMFNLSF